MATSQDKDKGEDQGASSAPPAVFGWKGFTGDLSIQSYPCLSPYKIRSIAAGGGHVLFLTENGKVFGRGHNAHGQLGLGEQLVGHAQSEPLLIHTLSDEEIVAVAGGRSHSAAVTIDGDVYCWGDSSDGQCGTGSLDKVVVPTKVKIAIHEGFCEHGLPRPEVRAPIDSVACGATHTLALSVQEEVWAWGCGEQLGMEELVHAPVPRRVESLIGRRVLMVACGDSHSLALLKKADRSPKPEASPARSREVSKDNVVTQKHYPSMCAKCKKEIYTYTDSNDTCIIENEHECQADDSNLSFDTSLCLSGEGFASLKVASNRPSESADSSCTRPSPDKDSEDSALGTENVDSSADEQSENVTVAKPGSNEKSVTSAEGEATVPDQSNSAPSPSQQSSSGQKGHANEMGGNNEKQFVKGDNTPDPDASKRSTCDTSDVFSDPSSQVPEVGADARQGESSAEAASGPSVEQSVSVESDGEVWKRRSESEAQTPAQYEERVTAMDRSASVESACNRTSSGSAASLHKKSFVDESQARDYLARQFEDENAEEISRDDSPMKETTESSWKSFLPYSSSMMNTVRTMTSKAVNSIQSTMDSLVGQQNMELGDMSAAGAAATDQALSASSTLTTSVMSDSCGSLEFGLDLSPERRSSEKERSSQSPPSLSSSSHLSESCPEPGRQSLRTLEMKQQNIQRRISAGASKESTSEAEPAHSEVVMDTEVWAWGNNQKGQLGLGDELSRNKPVCVKMLNGRCTLKITAGSNHSLALTSNSQVYAWGANSYGQLGHTETGISPSRIKFMKGCCVWDLAGGTNHSVFLADSSGMKPDVFYCGKQPGKDAFSSMQKTALPTPVNEIKKLGWVRGLSAGGDSCYCKLGASQLSSVSAIYELAASERAFYQELVKINANLLKPLTRSSFFTVMDVFPYKSSLHNLVSGFMSLTKKIGQGVSELTEVVRQDQPIMSTSLLRSYSDFIKEFRRYSQFFADFLAIGGFEYCARTGSEFFDKNQGRDSPARSGEERQQEGRGERAYSRFQRSMQYPFLRLKEYSRLLQKLVESVDGSSEASNLLQKAVVSWDTLKLTCHCRAQGCRHDPCFLGGGQRSTADALRIPSRRMIMDSKSHPLLMPAAGRFSSYLFILFNDMFVYLQSNSHTIFPLETLWVEAPVTDADQLPGIVVISPEDRIELSVSTQAEKAEWLMAFNSAINKVLSSQKEVGRRGSAERLTPPLVRHANHTFARHARWRDGTYVGTWLSGKMHGQGEIKWPDGRKYTGTFKHGLQNGQGVFVIPKGGSGKEVQDGTWKDGKLNGSGHIRYSNGDDYKGYFQSGQRFGHGVLQQGRHLSSYASIYVGEWLNDKRNGYGVQDDVLKGETYMGMWVENHRHGNGIIVTLDGMYFEGNFYTDKLTGFGLMLTDDNSCYEGEFMDITQLSGKGTLTLPTGDQLDGTFSGSWNEGLKISGTFIKSQYSTPERRVQMSPSIKSKYYTKLAVPADKKWDDIFHHCCSLLGHDTHDRSINTKKAWEMVAVAVSNGKKQLKEMQKTSAAKAKLQAAGLEELETIPPHDASVSLTVESYAAISQYLRKAFDTTFHPLGQLMENLIDVFRAAYIGVGAHPRLLHHAVQEVNSYIRRMYAVLRILFPQLPASGGPLRVFPNNYEHPPMPSDTEDMQEYLEQQQEQEGVGEIVTAAGLLYPILLPKIYPPLFDLYALYNDRSDDRYWERVSKLNRQGDMALMAFLGIDQKYWLMDDILLEDKAQKLSSTRDVCYASAVDALQQLSTAFSPMDKLLVIEATFNEITQTVQGVLGEDHMWCMDELFPIFQFVVVRAKIRHLGAEISMIDDLMERHMEHGELGIMFTMLKASFFQIQNEKMPHH
ncbi:LOW QUALITY PROTEIN: alsin-like [Babylonia areolata]|uniref:LOW QUALITY PROTEIN: alsin-like n=1 Tax=Babylonia areolata TaxID=304850 RepID=UPI003FCF87F6